MEMRRTRCISIVSALLVLACAGLGATVLSADVVVEEADDPEVYFARFDVNGNGRLDLAEYGQMYMHNEGDGEATDADEAWKTYFEAADASGDGELTYDEWWKAMLYAMGQQDYQDAASCPGAAEGKAGLDGTAARSGAGRAAPSEGAANGASGREAGHGSREDQDAVMFARAFDADGDGSLDLTEFRELMSGDGLDGGEEDEEVDEVAEVFEKWDATMDGRLSAEELAHGLSLAAGHVPDIPTEFYKKLPTDDFGRVVDPDTMKLLQEDDREHEADGANPAELFAMVRAGDVQQVAHWLDIYNLPDGGVNDGTCSPLHVALQQFDKAVNHLHLGPSPGNLTAVAVLLIERGADLRHECDEVYPLMRAVLVRCLPVVRTILSIYTAKVAAEEIPRHDTLVQFEGGRNDLSPGGGGVLHAAAYLHPVAIAVSKILTAHPGAGPANRKMREEHGVSWREETLHRCAAVLRPQPSPSTFALDPLTQPSPSHTPNGLVR